MSREHSPRPGLTWERVLLRSEAVTNDPGEPDMSGPDGNHPLPPLLNRETRRALKRARKDRT